MTMSNPVPRGTHPVAEDWPAILLAQEAEQVGEEWAVAPVVLAGLRGREMAAGFAHFDRLAVDGGPVVEMPRRRRVLTEWLPFWGCIAVCVVAAIIVVQEVLR